jgi:hypothetical protein
MKNLKKYAGLLNDVAPEGEFLAYINEDESKILKDAGATGLLTPQGIPSYRGAGGYQGGSTSSGSSSSSSSSGSGSGSSSSGGGGGGQDYSSVPASTPTVSAPTYSGGGQDISTVSAAPPSIGNGDDGRLNYLTGDYQDINLTPEQKEQFSDYREGISEAISPSTKTSSKIISSLLSSTLFPFAGNLYNKYIDATAMGYSIPNPFEGLFDGGNITPESIQNFQDKGGDGQQSLINNAISQLPYAMTGTTPQDSMVNQYFANQPTSSLSSGLETSYNNAKSNINNILGITAPSQQFGYSQAPYGSYSSTNMAGNPYKDYLTTRGLI